MANDHHPPQERHRGSSTMKTTTTTTSSLEQSHKNHGHGHSDSHAHGRHHGNSKHSGQKHRAPSCQPTSHPYPQARAQHPHPHPHPHPQASSAMQAQPSPSAPPPPTRLPASSRGSVHRHYHHHSNNRNGQEHTALASATPVDPEAMPPAEQGLEDWGCIAGGGGGTFGLGPLLFHAGGEHGDDEGLVREVGGHTPTQQQAGPERTTRKMDLFEMDRLLQNDPISFNPLHAISWANLDDAPMDDEGSLTPASAGIGGERSGNSVGSSQLEERGGLEGRLVVGGKPRSGSRDEYAGPQHVDAQVTSLPIPTSTEPSNSHNNMCVAPCHIGRGTDHAEPSPSPVGTMSKTFSTVRLQTPDTTAADARSIFVPPPPPPPLPPHVSSSSHAAPVVGGGQHGQRQQRKQRHRNGTKTSPHGGPSPMLSEVYQQQQQQQVYQPRPPPPPPFTANTPSLQPNFHPFAQQVVDPYSTNPITCQTTPSYTISSSSSSSSSRNNSSQPQHSLPQPPHPHHHHQHQQPQPQQDLFLCLGPYCSARFPTEAELNAHYRAEHSLACSWSSCGAAGFTSNNALVWHVKAEHLLLCPVPGCCDRVFASKKALEGHVRVN